MNRLRLVLQSALGGGLLALSFDLLLTVSFIIYKGMLFSNFEGKLLATGVGLFIIGVALMGNAYFADVNEE